MGTKRKPVMKPDGKKNRIARIIVVSALIVTAAAAAAGFARYKSSSVTEYTAVASIGNEPIQYGEFTLVRDMLRSTAKPEELNAKTLQRVKEFKTEQLWAKEKGLAAGGLGFGDFEKRWRQENARRKAAADHGEPVYGPVSYDPAGYYRYEQSNLQLRLKEALAGQDFAAGDAELQAAYERLKDDRFMRPSKIRLQLLSAENSASGAEKLNRAAARLKAGEAFESQAGQADSGLRAEARWFEPEDRKADAERYPALLQEAEGLQPGQTSGVIGEGERLYIIRCAERGEAEYEPFEDVKERVRILYTDERYAAELASRLARTDIIVLKPLESEGEAGVMK
ncbi:peptidyl-prolyl cis-trans isomerase [Paenibacillus chitinolyticus]|uniref:peptidylprolyl isomerase n=1 Tax=Paenibacillus chitinolyticus TaxID=79263 RepID=UPI001C455563|nr:peptidylprolyl isomerase [Paenibacillus chitinolyticus]MBV6715350.1 peptidyl-prolyl cis-trans isomerase [Paenibacillus chitinolyticus]